MRRPACLALALAALAVAGCGRSAAGGRSNEDGGGAGGGPGEVGSVGGLVAPGGAFPQVDAPDPTPLATAPAVVHGSDVRVLEIPLADSVEGELVFLIEPNTFACGFGPPGVGLLVDDLRLE